MPRIILIAGLTENTPSAPVSLVYLGRVGSEARKAMEASASPRFLIVQQVQGTPKNNPHAAANLAKLAASAELAGAELKTALAERDESRAVLALAETSFKKIEADLATVRGQLTAERKSYEKDIAALQTKLTAAETALAAQKTEAQTKADAQAASIISLTSELEALKAAQGKAATAPTETKPAVTKAAPAKA